MSQELNRMWEEQRDFNLNFFPSPEGFEQQSLQTKEFCLHMISEVDELLRCTSWKVHRKNDVLVNPQQVRDEISDILKYFISLCNVWGISPQEMIEGFWRKSMVCRQRHSEEFVKSMEGKKILLCDIDGVLANYVQGILKWMTEFVGSPYCAKASELLESQDEYDRFIEHSSLGLSPAVYQEIKHRFRTERGKLTLPVYAYAKAMLQWFNSQGYHVILLTSRPIDMYPNIYTETLEWLQKNDLFFDHIWWSTNKSEKIYEKGLAEKVDVYIEDDYSFVRKMAPICKKVIWIDRFGLGVPADMPSNVQRVRPQAMEQWVENLQEEVLV